ncbi:hypothetical protein CDAR_565791 [Caerostris darwini]|uniref:Uncharacterized protein n=1 Tax=Caerostris darwini TaxID=1538125 RepID=A0AAV4V004_9ARAC|nr:hypothetical protein CDAR_565791 [Caerostris darwini]
MAEGVGGGRIRINVALPPLPPPGTGCKDLHYRRPRKQSQASGPLGPGPCRWSSLPLLLGHLDDCDLSPYEGDELIHQMDE